MSLLYPNHKTVKTCVDIKTFADGTINLLFYSNVGKFGTDEVLDEFTLTVDELLKILQSKSL